jgi:hypothetical protein
MLNIIVETTFKSNLQLLENIQPQSVAQGGIVTISGEQKMTATSLLAKVRMIL